jgi:hypothetical protein
MTYCELLANRPDFLAGDQIDTEEPSQDGKLRDVLHVGQAAWETVFGDRAIEVNQGIPLTSLEARLLHSLAAQLVPKSERRFEVLPETVAPIVSMSFNPRTPPGIYLIIDMGGGTTEISVNRVGKSGTGTHVICYFDRVLQVGGMDFANLANRRVAEVEVPKLLSDLSRAIVSTWYKGYEKIKDGPLKDREDWKQLRVMLAGGGTLYEKVAECISSLKPPQAHIWPDCLCEVSEDRYVPGDVDLGKLNSSDGIDLSFLAVADGLAIAAQRWPALVQPHDVYQHPPRRDDEGPDPFWYVGGK